MSRQNRFPYSPSDNNAKEVFELIHLDIRALFSTHYVHQYRYFLTILDDCSRHVWTVMLKLKSEVGDKVKTFINMVETQFDKKVRVVRSDNGLEFFLLIFILKREFYITQVVWLHHNKMIELRDAIIISEY